jgi:hypothetical protein
MKNSSFVSVPIIEGLTTLLLCLLVVLLVGAMIYGARGFSLNVISVEGEDLKKVPYKAMIQRHPVTGRLQAVPLEETPVSSGEMQK